MIFGERLPRASRSRRSRSPTARPAGTVELGHLAVVHAVGVDDDAAGGGLAEDLRQADDRARAPESMMSASTWPGPTDGSWSTSPTRMRAARGGHGARPARASAARRPSTSRRRRAGRASSGFDGPRRKRPSAGFTSSSRWMVFASRPGDLGQALGRAARRRAQRHADALRAEDREDGADDRRLADAGAAGDDEQLRREGLAAPRRAAASASVRASCCSTHGSAFSASMAGQGGAPCRQRPQSRRRAAAPSCAATRGRCSRGPPVASATTVPSASSASSAASTTSAGTSSSFCADAHEFLARQAALALVERLRQRVARCRPGRGSARSSRCRACARARRRSRSRCRGCRAPGGTGSP